MSLDSDREDLVKQTNFSNLINKDHIEQMIECQTEIMSKLDRTNETLINCNAIAKSKLSTLNKTFKRSTQQIIEIKKDVDAIHRKVRSLKAKIIADHPDCVKKVEGDDASGESSPIRE